MYIKVILYFKSILIAVISSFSLFSFSIHRRQTNNFKLYEFFEIDIRFDRKNTHPVVDERLPALDDGDPLGVPRGPPVDGRVDSHAQVLDLVSIVDS